MGSKQRAGVSPLCRFKVEKGKETWSNMTSERYKKIIDGIKKEITKNIGLWSIEKHWEGHQ